MTANGTHSKRQFGEKIYYVISSAIIGIALIICAVVVSNTAMKVKSLGQSISVTGAAFHRITSNYGIWSGTISVTGPTLSGAYALVSRDMQTTKDFLNESGYPDSLLKTGVVRIRHIEKRNAQTGKYVLTQSVTVSVDDVTRIASLANDAGKLIELGIEFI